MSLCIEQAATPVELQPHSQGEWNVETVIGRFVDAGWAYRFGPPAQHAVVVSLERDGGPDVGSGAIEAGLGSGDPETGSRTICQAVRFPAGRPLDRESPERLGIEIETTPLGAGELRLALTSRRLVYGVRIDAPGFLPSDNGFFIEPGGTRGLTLRPTGPDSSLEHGRVLALNMDGQIELAARVPVEVAAP